ncbi:hypothetical protein V6O07_10265, partial [Arthrospira platensis SPKY2]
MEHDCLANRLPGISAIETNNVAIAKSGIVEGEGENHPARRMQTLDPSSRNAATIFDSLFHRHGPKPGKIRTLGFILQLHKPAQVLLKGCQSEAHTTVAPRLPKVRGQSNS